MKMILSILVLLVTITGGYSQNERQEYKKVNEAFIRQYNTNRYDSIFLSFSPHMQAALPQERTAQFFSGFKSQVGQLKTSQFLNQENVDTDIYKGVFDRAIFSIRLSLDDQGKIAGFLLKPFMEDVATPAMRNSTKLQLPFKDEWTVFWGGDTREQNYHVEYRAQKHAFDMIMTDKKGMSFRTNGAANEDYYAFGKELLSPCDALVVLVLDGVKDNAPGTLNPEYVTGNMVVLKASDNEYLLFAHFKSNSIKVKEGQKVKQGELLGLCGNSGNSSEPHLHFHIQHVQDMNAATGVKCYFDTLLVNGKRMMDYSPVKGDKVKIAN